MRKTLCLFIALFFAADVWAQPLADKVPANSLLYFGWRGSDDLGPAYADSHLKAVLDQCNLRQVFNDMVPRAIMRVGRESPQAADILRSATSIAGPMWRHPCAFYLADIDIDAPQPMPHAGILCQAGNDAPQLLAKLQTLVQQAGNSPMPIRAFQSGDIVALTFGYAENEDAVALASGKSLMNDASFTSAASNVPGDSVIALYVNFEHVWSLVDAAIQKGDAQAKEYWPRIRDASGLAGLKRLILTGAFNGKDWMDQAFIEAPSPHAGLLTLMDSQPLTDDLLRVAPADADQMSAGDLNFAKLLSVLRAAVTQVDPNAGAMVEKVIGAISLYVGRDFQKEVLEPIGEHWVCYSSPTIAGRGMLGGIVVNQLNDPKKAESGIVATQIAAFNTAAAFLYKYHITLRTQDMKTDDATIHYLAIPLVSPSWSIKGQNLFISLYPQNIIGAQRFVASGGKTILDNPNFVDLRKRLNAPANLSGISYVDLTQTLGEGYQGMLAMSRLVLGIGDLFGVKSPEPVVPPLDVLLKNVGPSGGISYIDEKGWHSRAVSSFPGAELLNGGNNPVFSMIPQLMGSAGAIIPQFAPHRQDFGNQGGL
ncbi:MAG TPA: hypothetical protein VHS31_09695 [Tepidisphaeraceae bacterium]|nr:hypothetical protein [Tepidisphaeraceae bacterium]